jgi:hypothetical protein
LNPLQGDYDIDGDVDRDDYTVWKNTFGSNLLLAADGNGNGRVDAADYTVWRNQLGATLPATGSASMSQSLDAFHPSPADSDEGLESAAVASPESIDLALADIFRESKIERANAPIVANNESTGAPQRRRDALLALLTDLAATAGSRENAPHPPTAGQDFSSKSNNVSEIDDLFAELRFEASFEGHG